MIKNYFKTAWRNLWKGRVFNLMNVIGLSVAIACCILLFLTVYYQFSYDTFHQNLDNTYEVYFKANRSSGVDRSTAMPLAMANALKNEYQDVKYVTRYNTGGTEIQYGDKKLEESLSFVDQDFLNIFTFPIVKGNQADALRTPNQIVISETIAKAIFDKENPIGKTLQLKYGTEQRSFVVSVVAKDAPANSSIRFDVLLRFENNINYLDNLKRWDNRSCLVFFLLNPQVTAESFNQKLISFTQKYFKEDISNIKRDGGTKDASGNYFSTNITPFSKNHFNTELTGLAGSPISKSYVLSLLAIGIFILLIACINFINLSVARGFTRAREVGVRKTLGAGKWQLLIQFWTETVIVCLIALVAGILLAQLILPGFKATFRTRVSLDLLLHPQQFVSALGIFVLLTFIAGFYPALLMMRFKTVQVLKGSVNVAKPGKVRNVLLVVQFALSTLLIICTLVTWQQMNYIQSRPLGYNQTEVVSIPVGHSINGSQALQLFRNQLNNDPAVVSLTGVYNNLGRGADGSSFTSISSFNYKGHEVRTHLQRIDYDFIKTLSIDLVEGRDFSKAFSTDTNAVIINQKMAAQLGGKNLIGSYLPMNDTGPKIQIIGIVKDYNFRTLHEDVQPLTMCMWKDFPVNYIFVRVKPGNLVNTLDHLKSQWKHVFPNADFRGSWLNENTEKQYQDEKRLSTIFISSAIIAIVISCIGLLAMSIMVMVQRTKEIGIRKVLGANVAGIVLMLTRDFLKLVLLSAILAFPLAWWVMDKWLQGFAYRIQLAWWTFATSAALSLLIAFITVSFQSIRAAIANPVKSLRSE